VLLKRLDSGKCWTLWQLHSALLNIATVTLCTVEPINVQVICVNKTVSLITLQTQWRRHGPSLEATNWWNSQDNLENIIESESSYISTVVRAQHCLPERHTHPAYILPTRIPYTHSSPISQSIPISPSIPLPSHPPTKYRIYFNPYTFYMPCPTHTIPFKIHVNIIIQLKSISPMEPLPVRPLTIAALQPNYTVQPSHNLHLVRFPSNS
jgi:hypothetical protein